MRCERVATLLLMGCSGATVSTADSATSPPPPPACEPGIELGTGVDAFEPLSDGQALRMVFGPQGGYHLPLALRGCAVGEPIRTDVVGTTGEGQVVVDVSLTHTWVAEDACCGVLLDLRGYLFVDDYDWVPTALDGQPAVVALQATEIDAGTPPMVDQVEVVILAP